MTHQLSPRGFTTKRAEQRIRVCTYTFDASAGRKPFRGFTLLETLVAVSILAFAVAGPLFTANRAFIASQVSRDQLIASYLAQEGIEYVRAMRDYKYLQAYSAGSTNSSCSWVAGPSVSCAAWLNFLSGSDTAGISACLGGTCTIEPGYAPQACSGSGCAVLKLVNNGTTNMYTIRADLSGTNSPFTRTIRATTISTSEIVASSTVSWSFKGSAYSVSAAVHLTPWQ
jgi:prepilin-type N-terminal cleavage/methylation domain-containing protein